MGAHLDLRQKGANSASMQIDHTCNSTAKLIETPNMVYCWHRRVPEADGSSFRSMFDSGHYSSLEVIARQGREMRGLLSNHLVGGGRSSQAREHGYTAVVCHIWLSI